ncbi:MAG: hypothetical protein IJT73_03555 [Selenomonadaceae bacterium]|nr:hypothetical protein [Selenomonadaceae bacterium]
MTKIKKLAVIVAVVFVTAFCAGWAIFQAVADYTTQQLEAKNQNGN